MGSTIITQASNTGSSAMTECLAASTIAISTTPAAFTDGTTTLSVSITPSSTSSKIIIMGNINANSNATNYTGFILKRNGSALFVGDSAGNRKLVTVGAQGISSAGGTTNIPFSYLDSPASVSAQTYSIDIIGGSSVTGHVNRGSTDTDAAATYRTTSRIIVLEIKA